MNTKRLMGIIIGLGGAMIVLLLLMDLMMGGKEEKPAVQPAHQSAGQSINQSNTEILKVHESPHTKVVFRKGNPPNKVDDSSQKPVDTKPSRYQEDEPEKSY